MFWTKIFIRKIPINMKLFKLIVVFVKFLKREI